MGRRSRAVAFRPGAARGGLHGLLGRVIRGNVSSHEVPQEGGHSGPRPGPGVRAENIN